MLEKSRIAELLITYDHDSRKHYEHILEVADTIERIERATSRTWQHYANLAGLTLLEGEVLASIYDQSADARPGIIAEKVRIPLSTMTGVIARLEQRELVVRTRAGDDGRSYLLAVTKEGEQRLKAMLGPLFAALNQEIEMAEDGVLERILGTIKTVCTIVESMEQHTLADDFQPG